MIANPEKILDLPQALIQNVNKILSKYFFVSENYI
jgi:hypothetical protein